MTNTGSPGRPEPSEVGDSNAHGDQGKDKDDRRPQAFKGIEKSETRISVPIGGDEENQNGPDSEPRQNIDRRGKLQGLGGKRHYVPAGDAVNGSGEARPGVSAVEVLIDTS